MNKGKVKLPGILIPHGEETVIKILRLRDSKRRKKFSIHVKKKGCSDLNSGFHALDSRIFPLELGLQISVLSEIPDFLSCIPKPRIPVSTT